MSTKQSPSSEFDGARLGQLISAWCDGVIPENDLQELQATLSACGAAREVFLAYMQIHTHMQGQGKAIKYLETFTPLPPGIPELPSSLPLQTPSNFLQSVRLLTKRFNRWGWAALLLLGIFGWSMAHRIRSTTAPIADQYAADNVLPPRQSNGSESARTVLARVTDHSDDCQWYFDEGAQTHCAPSGGICGGQTVRVTKGIMKLTFDNGTVVTLHAPALFQVISEMRTQCCWAQ